MNWIGKRVLVTGAGGFIGSHLTERLVELGAHTRAFVHYHADGSWGWLDRSVYKTEMEVVAGDVTDRDSIASAVQKCDIVFHLAALIAIPYSYQSPLSFLRTNVEGTFNVLQTVRSLEVPLLVHTSTSEVYGTARRVPIDERHPLQAQSPYAATKIGADKLAESFFLSYATPVVTVRPFNTFGPRQSARAVIPTIITQYLAGTTVQLGNLSPTRDLNYVGNTVDGFLHAAACDQAIGQTINIGSGREIRIGDLVELIGRLLGKETNVVTDHNRIRPVGSEVERLLADNTLARTSLNWEPRVSLEEGLKLTIEWFRDHVDHYRPGTYVV